MEGNSASRARELGEMLGYSTERVEEALFICNGNEEMAVDYLLNQAGY